MKDENDKSQQRSNPRKRSMPKKSNLCAEAAILRMRDGQYVQSMPKSKMLQWVSHQQSPPQIQSQIPKRLTFSSSSPGAPPACDCWMVFALQPMKYVDLGVCTRIDDEREHRRWFDDGVDVWGVGDGQS
jgi:hypothetical protein